MSVQALELSRPRHRTLPEILADREAIHHIAANGYVEMPWDPVWTTLYSKAARDDFWRLLASSDRDLFVYKKATEADDQGLFDRNGEKKDSLSLREAAEKSTSYDNKFYFHCYPWTRDVLRRQGAPVDDYQKLFNACAEFNHMAMRFALAVGDGLDQLNAYASVRKRYPGSMVERFTKAPVVTRLLRYKSKDKDAPLGKIHRDRCALTAHWFSSHPGLKLFGPDKQPIAAADHDPSQILLFLGEKAWSATRGQFGTGVLHGASNLVHGFDPDEDRFVVVTFVHCKLDFDDLRWKEDNRSQLEINPADYPL
jgi:hypothetical protein